MSIADDLSLVLLDSSLAWELTSVAPIAAIPTRPQGNGSGASGDAPGQQGRHAKEDSGANPDFDRFKADMQAQSAPALSSDLSNDLSSLLNDLTSGNTSAAKTDVSKVQVDLQTKDASLAGSPAGDSLSTLISKTSDSLNAGIAQGAPQDELRHDLADFLVENGRGTGSLINTSA